MNAHERPALTILGIGIPFDEHAPLQHVRLVNIPDSSLLSLLLQASRVWVEDGLIHFRYTTAKHERFCHIVLDKE